MNRVVRVLGRILSLVGISSPEDADARKKCGSAHVEEASRHPEGGRENVR